VIAFNGSTQGSKRCPAQMRRARAGSVHSTEIAVSGKKLKCFR